jgi:hypothetical protein
MAKKPVRRKASARLPDEVTAAATLEKMRLRRLVAAKRDIARLVVQLRTASLKADMAVEDFALNVVQRRGWKLKAREDPAAQPEPAGALEV